jgi:hypothetical protein
VKSFGGRLITADLRQERGSIHHNVEKLAQLLASVMNETLVGSAPGHDRKCER